MNSAVAPPTSRASRYATLFKLASGGMASVWVGTVRGGLGFRQLVAIKKPHPHLLDAPDFRAELLAEASLASSIHHANVVDVRDVEVCGDDVSLVMDYIEGASLAELLIRSQGGGPQLLPAIAVRICLDALAGLHAAHELTDDRGRLVGLIHRDVSPQNILVGVDGLARVADFGVAKFKKKDHATTTGQLKGKVAYMAPEYLRNEPIDRTLDVFAMGVVLWEALTGRRLFRGAHDGDTIQRVLKHEAPPVGSFIAAASAFDPVLDQALAKDCTQRFQSAAAMATALESAARSAGLLASPSEVGAFVRQSYGVDLEQRREKIRERLADEPSVASLFEGAKMSPILPAAGPASISPPTLKDPALGPPSNGPGGDLAATLRDDGPAKLVESPPTSSRARDPHVGSVPSVAAATQAYAASELSLSAYDAASIPRPSSGRFVGLALGAALVTVVVVAAIVARAVLSSPSPTATHVSPLAASASASPSASALAMASSSAPGIVSPPAPVAKGSTSSPKAAAPLTKPTSKPAGPPPNPYAH